MAQAASTALPPRANIIAPAVAPSGLPVMAIQCRAWRGGFCVCGRCWAEADAGTAVRMASPRTSRNGSGRMTLMLARATESRQRHLHTLGPPPLGPLLRPLLQAVHLRQSERELPSRLGPAFRFFRQTGEHQLVEGARDPASAAAGWRVRGGMGVTHQQRDRVLRG